MVETESEKDGDQNDGSGGQKWRFLKTLKRKKQQCMMTEMCDVFAVRRQLELYRRVYVFQTNLIFLKTVFALANWNECKTAEQKKCEGRSERDTTCENANELSEFFAIHELKCELYRPIYPFPRGTSRNRKREKKKNLFADGPQNRQVAASGPSNRSRVQSLAHRLQVVLD